MKKKTLQRLAAAGLALAMVAGTLTGCGGGNDAAGNDNADAAQTEDAATSEDTSADDAAQADDGAAADAEGDTAAAGDFTDYSGGKAGILQTTTGRNGFRRTLAKSIT